ncbi:MAG: serine/threonine protein kinase [Candidatus Bathyarchaeota archaeon]|nr:MAG: serine/threonine protein kinase [Candidatus Bathyarchaeota archaeon]
MSSAERAASLLLELEPEEFRVLQAIELGMADYSYVPMEEILRYAGFPQAEVEFRLGELDKKDLIYRQLDPYPGYILNNTGYDILALNALAKGGNLNSLGRSLGVGKEADIYDAITDDGVRVAVKFHRLGRISFRETRKKRDYVSRRSHTPWHYQSRLAAEKEYSVMRQVFQAEVSTPEPLHQNRHALVMGFIDGYNLVDVATLDDPDGFLSDILQNARMTYRAGVIHADLSEYNIVVQKSGEVLLIDWPQAVPTDHPNAENLLRRDIYNVLRYFERKFKLRRDLEEALDYVKS